MFSGAMGDLAHNLGVVILAAGRSGRMGRPKPLLPWGETSILGHQIRTWQQLGAGVVCAAGDAAIEAELGRLRFLKANRILNPQPERGMFSSIRCGAQWPGWTPDLTHWAISLGDQPHVRLETLRTLLAFSASHPTKVCQPCLRGRARHPVILPKKIFFKLGQTSASTLKEFLQTIPESVAHCEVGDPSLEFDIDTPADYERALALCFGVK
jgi:molybdenum cofactor cytidylyltransferase